MDKVGGCCLAILAAPIVLLGVTWILNKICWLVLCLVTGTPFW